MPVFRRFIPMVVFAAILFLAAGPVMAQDQAQDEARITTLLNAAEADLAAFRLTSPAGNNAYDKYAQVLNIDPGNARAKAGLSRIVDTYVNMADQALAVNDPARAKTYLDRAESVIPNDIRIANMRTRLAAAPQVRPQPQPVGPRVMRSPRGYYTVTAPPGWYLTPSPPFDMFLTRQSPYATFSVEVVENTRGEMPTSFFSYFTNRLMSSPDNEMIEGRLIRWRDRQANRVIYRQRSTNQTVLAYALPDRGGRPPARFFIMKGAALSQNYSYMVGVLQTIVDSFNQLY